MTSRTWLLWIAVVAALWPSLVTAGDDGIDSVGPVTIFGAASLSDALNEIGAVYRASFENHGLRFSFAASSTLARQIEAGAPAGIFASASAAWMDYLQDRDLIDPNSRVSPVGNTLILIAPADSSPAPIRLDHPAPLQAVLGVTGRLAMGDPAHVPAGMYAKQALQSLGLWDSLQSQTAFANDARGVLALVERGEAPLGIAYATDAAISDGLAVLATFPPTSHEPIRYSFALVAGQSSPEATDMIAFMSNQTALEIFRRHGFVVP